MSDNLLKAILNLLVIVAQEDEVTTSERQAIQEFLDENVNSDECAKYMEYFEEQVSSYAHSNESDEKKEIINLSYKVNKELKQEQKLVVLLRLMELIVADGKISAREKELLYLIGTSLNFPNNVIDHLKSYVVGEKATDFAAKSVTDVT